ncbi:trypsin-like serine peptidase [Nonomuraea sp. NPDC059007]|uniref:trypsin-like serine peptidase n=1 Tax=Nonomuraea sp. NPDC059007 TaxID=3346692 RepID=UPI0036C25E2B
MKRILLPAGGAILATGLLAAGLAGAAQAEPNIDADALAASNAKAAEVLNFWTKSNNAALRQATAYYWDNKDVKKIVEKGGYVGNTKPGELPPIGAEKKVTVKSHNVNLPKSIGKVFFEGRDGNLYWCSGTSIQAKYRNLVSTAGHCAYDYKNNGEVVSKWVFVPGYYQGKTPWGIYVGKQAFTHYDFSNYEDFDRDYAFVTVYNGIGGVQADAKKVTKKEYDAYQGSKDTKVVEVTAEEYKKGKLDPATTDDYDVEEGSADEASGPDYPGAVVGKVEVLKGEYDLAKVGKGNGFKYGEPVVEHVTYDEAVAYIKKQKPSWKPGQALPAPTKDYPGVVAVDGNTNATITHYFVQQWYKAGKATKYTRTDYYIFSSALKDVGRLGDNVGGQGFSWNQGTGKVVRTFGYPYSKHPDGSKPYSGVTPKWCYGKTGPKATKVASLKIEEHVSLKCAVTGGYNGAPWLLKYSNAKRMGYVNGVTSVLYDTDGNDRWDYMSSPYFDEETHSVYSAAANVWSGPITAVAK